jgi:oxygen-independent coproporphyrinogen-3 oxidase
MAAGVYLHIPFCRSRCSYCDFATDIYRTSEAVDRYVAALCKEVGAFERTGGDPSGCEGVESRKNTLPAGRISAFSIDTIYFGGGTPSLLTPAQVERILKTVSDKFSVDIGPEITMEMNPATVTPDTLREYKALGVNRASFGVQTFNDRALKLLARGHDANDARRTYEMLRDAGYENISFDLIAGLPGQTLKDWERNLDEAIQLSPEHLSLYLLEIHEGTPLAEQVRSGRRPAPDEDLAAEMYRMMQAKLAAAGFEQYEISNYAKPGFGSRHNTKYWRLEPVFGFGVSAHSFNGRERFANERDNARYVELIESSGSAEVTRLPINAQSEYVFLGLRMNEGIDAVRYRERFGVDLFDRYGNDLAELKQLDLVGGGPDRLWLTGKGMLYSNEVFAKFV